MFVYEEVGCSLVLKGSLLIRSTTRPISLEGLVIVTATGCISLSPLVFVLKAIYIGEQPVALERIINGF